MNRRKNAVDNRLQKRKHPKHKKRRRRKKGLLHRLVVFVLLFTVGYCGFYVYYRYGKPYTVALDAGHGGDDVGAEGIIQEVELTEQTVSALADLLKADGRFRVVCSRRNNETKSITDRSRKFEKVKPDLVLSVHGNAEDSGTAYGFECYPAVPGMKNHEKSMQFAKALTKGNGNCKQSFARGKMAYDLDIMSNRQKVPYKKCFWMLRIHKFMKIMIHLAY